VDSNGGGSNKGKVYVAWHKGEKDTSNLLKLTDGGVQEKTIKLWLNSWTKGNNLPACAKK